MTTNEFKVFPKLIGFTEVKFDDLKPQMHIRYTCAVNKFDDPTARKCVYAVIKGKTQEFVSVGPYKPADWMEVKEWKIYKTSKFEHRFYYRPSEPTSSTAKPSEPTSPKKQRTSRKKKAQPARSRSLSPKSE